MALSYAFSFFDTTSIFGIPIVLLTKEFTYTARNHETIPNDLHDRSGLPLPSPEHPRLEPSQDQRPQRMLQAEPRRWQRHRDFLLG